MEDYHDPEATEQPFTGRNEFLKSLQNIWMKNRVFGIFGQKSVGKSRTVEEFLKRLQYHLGDQSNLKIISVDLQNVTSVETFSLKTLHAFDYIDEISTNSDDWVLQMCKKIDTDFTHAYILSFDNAEDCLTSTLKDIFIATCSTIIQTCHNIRIIFSSTVQVTRGFPFFIWQELQPMDTADGSELVKSIATRVRFGGHLEKIVELCCGLPLALIIAAFEMNQQGPVAPSPEDMIEILSQCRLRALSDESYIPEEQVGAVYYKFISQLTREFQQRLAILGYIPGSFRDIQACHLLDDTTKSETIQQTLVPLKKRYMIQFQPKTRRYNIHGILQDCLEVYLKIENLPEIRKRYCRTFSKVMKELSLQMESEEYLEAYAVFSQEYPNLKKLLTDVQYSAQETFPFYIEMAASASSLIIEYFGNESIMYFTKCFELAKMYGKERDRAVAMTHYGRALTNVKCDFNGGIKMLTQAVAILEQFPPSEFMSSILLSLGWTYHLQGRPQDAIKQFERGLSVLKEADCENSIFLYRHINCIGLSNIVERNLTVAENYMFHALRGFIKKLGEDHPSVGSVYNNIGLLMKRKEDHLNAKKYFERGLEIKLKNKAPLKAVIASQKNVAVTYIELGRLQEAKTLLDAALASLEFAPDLFSYERVIILETMHQLYLKQGNAEDAISSLEMAVSIRENYNKGSVAH